MDVAVAGDTEGGGVSLACHMHWLLLADFAHLDSRLTGREVVGVVDFGVAVNA